MASLIKTIGKLFGKYPVHFPVDDTLSIIIGPNGAGKTQTLLLLKEWYEKQDENVLYFPVERKLTCTHDDVINAQMISKLIANYDPFEKYEINVDRLDFDFLIYEKSYLSSGHIQIANFFGTIMKQEKKPTVLIDFPEINLDYTIKERFIEDMLKCCTPRRLIIVTHQPEIIADYMNQVVDITTCVSLR